MQRRQIEEDKDALNQRQQQPDRHPETVEQRHGVKQTVGLKQVHHREQLADVGQQVAVGKLHGFGGAFRAAGEEDDRRILRGRLIIAQWQPEKRSCGRGELLPNGNSGARVFQKQRLHASCPERLKIERQPFNKRSRGDDVFQTGQARAFEQNRRTSRVIEDRRGPSRRP